MMSAMPMQSGMMGMVPMNTMPQMMSSMMPQPMMGGMMPQMMMGQMPMMPMPMMTPMMMPMACRMTCEMGKDGMVCKLMPMDGAQGQMDMMRERCNAMNAMMAMGMPMMMMCGGMPIMMCMPASN